MRVKIVWRPYTIHKRLWWALVAERISKGSYAVTGRTVFVGYNSVDKEWDVMKGNKQQEPLHYLDSRDTRCAAMALACCYLRGVRPGGRDRWDR